jgi:hypothetical protein
LDLGKDGIEVKASCVVVQRIDEILNSQIDYMCKTWNMTKLQSADPLKQIYLVIPKDSELLKLLLQALTESAVISRIVGSNAKQFVSDVIIAQISKTIWNMFSLV